MSGKRGTARQWSSGGKIKDSEADQVYATLQKAVRVEQQLLPERATGTDIHLTVLTRPKTVRGGSALSPPDDVRAMLARALPHLHALARRAPEIRPIERALCRHVVHGTKLYRAFGYPKRGRGAPPYRARVRAQLARALEVLDRQRSKRPHARAGRTSAGKDRAWRATPSALRYVRLALHRHLELDLTPNQAFGYAWAARGAPPIPEEKARLIACEVFELRFIQGRKAEIAGRDAGTKFRVNRKLALAAFKDHFAHALRFHKLERIRKQANPLWTEDEMRRLRRYHSGLQRTQ